MQSTAEVWTKGRLDREPIPDLTIRLLRDPFSLARTSILFYNLFYGIWMYSPLYHSIDNIPDISLLQSLVFPQVSGQGKTAYQALHNVVILYTSYNTFIFFALYLLDFQTCLDKKVQTIT